MSRNKFLASRLREVLLDGHWIANTNYKEQVTGITWHQATYKIDSLNSIAALIFHINYYLDGILKAFDSGKLEIRDKYSFDLPSLTTETEWKDLLNKFLTNAEKFVQYVEQIEEARLDEPFIEEKYGTYLRNIEGVIEHSYYHLGQVVIIKKMMQ